jgi:tetratricopeptide (TPR) repeat protein
MAQLLRFKTASEEKEYTNYILLQKAFTASSQKDYSTAEICYKELLKGLSSPAPNVVAALAEALWFQEKHKEAAAFLRKAINVQPKVAKLHSYYGTVLSEIGRMKLAEKHLRIALYLDPKDTNSYYQLSLLGRGKIKPEDAEAMLAMIENFKIKDRHDRRLNFALGKYFEEKGEYEESFEFYQKGNASKYEEEPWDSLEWHRYFNRIRAVFDKKAFQSLATSSVGYSNIFIVGMPRSGTTLVEQILDSHSYVKGLGEKIDFMNLANRPEMWSGTNKPYPEFLLDLDAKYIQTIGKEYVSSLKTQSSKNSKFCEKLPTNFIILPLIYAALPKSKFIHISRDPLDTCLSCYTSLFSHGNQWSYSLSALIEFYKDYKAIMNHWKKVLPIEIYEIQYEDLVNNPNNEILELLDFCELEFDPNCLNFHRNKRIVHTASHYQVRQEINTRSVGRWKNYEPYLEDLKCLQNL